MNRTIKMIVPLLASIAAGCGDNTPMTNPDLSMMGPKPDMTVVTPPDMTMPGPPPPPTVGAEIDRMGRSAVNTALTDPFDLMGAMTTDNVKDAYNAVGDPTMWQQFVGNSKMHQYIAGNLAILDGADTKCGNQPGFMAMNNYTFLAGFLADDRLILDTTQTTCTGYLGVEANALLGTPADCGGRTPTENSVDVTYGVLIGQGVVNGISADAEGGASNTSFPFLGAPN